MTPDACARPVGPFEVWSVDLAGPFPADDEGHVYAIVAVDVFSKWTEIGLLSSKRAWRTTEWFYSEIIARWGSPSAVRLDNGGEWMAEFKHLMSGLGIERLLVTINNSKANGQAEKAI